MSISKKMQRIISAKYIAPFMFAVGLLFAQNVFAAWIPPTLPAPQGNADIPLNVSANPQTKAGDLTVGTIISTGIKTTAGSPLLGAVLTDSTGTGVGQWRPLPGWMTNATNGQTLRWNGTTKTWEANSDIINAPGTGNISLSPPGSSGGGVGIGVTGSSFSKLAVVGTSSFFGDILNWGNSTFYGSSAPGAGSVALEISSNTQGFLAPAMNSASMYAIANPRDGLMVYNMTASQYYYYDKVFGAWRPIGGAGSPVPNGTSNGETLFWKVAPGTQSKWVANTALFNNGLNNVSVGGPSSGTEAFEVTRGNILVKGPILNSPALPFTTTGDTASVYYGDAEHYVQGVLGGGVVTGIHGLTVTGTEATANGKNSSLTIDNKSKGGKPWTLRSGATGTTTPVGGFSIADSVNNYRFTIDNVGNVQLNSTTGGFLPQQMTTSQRNAISNPQGGTLIFNITTGSYEYYDANLGQWTSINAGNANVKVGTKVDNTLRWDGIDWVESSLLQTSPTDVKINSGNLVISNPTGNNDIQFNTNKRSTIYPTGPNVVSAGGNVGLQVRSAGTGDLQLNADNNGNILMAEGGGNVGIKGPASPYSTTVWPSSTGQSLAVLGNTEIITSPLSGPGSALLQLKSSTQGFLAPVMGTTSRNAISNPANGLIVYNADPGVQAPEYYDGIAGQWQTVANQNTIMNTVNPFLTPNGTATGETLRWDNATKKWIPNSIIYNPGNNHVGIGGNNSNSIQWTSLDVNGSTSISSTIDHADIILNSPTGTNSPAIYVDGPNTPANSDLRISSKGTGSLKLNGGNASGGSVLINGGGAMGNIIMANGTPPAGTNGGAVGIGANAGLQLPVEVSANSKLKLFVSGDAKISGDLFVGNSVKTTSLCLSGVCNSSWPTGVPTTGVNNGETLRYDGTKWLNNNNIFNDGNLVGIGASPLPGAKLTVGGITATNGLLVLGSAVIDTGGPVSLTVGNSTTNKGTIQTWGNLNVGNGNIGVWNGDINAGMGTVDILKNGDINVMSGNVTIKNIAKNQTTNSPLLAVCADANGQLQICPQMAKGDKTYTQAGVLLQWINTGSVPMPTVNFVLCSGGGGGGSGGQSSQSNGGYGGGGGGAGECVPHVEKDVAPGDAITFVVGGGGAGGNGGAGGSGGSTIVYRDNVAVKTVTGGGGGVWGSNSGGGGSSPTHAGGPGSQGDKNNGGGGGSGGSLTTDGKNGGGSDIKNGGAATCWGSATSNNQGGYGGSGYPGNSMQGVLGGVGCGGGGGGGGGTGGKPGAPGGNGSGGSVRVFWP